MNQLKEAILLLIANDGHSGPSAPITPWVATGKGIENAISAAIFCWRTSVMTAESMA